MQAGTGGSSHAKPILRSGTQGQGRNETPPIRYISGPWKSSLTSETPRLTNSTSLIGFQPLAFLLNQQHSDMSVVCIKIDEKICSLSFSIETSGK